MTAEENEPTGTREPAPDASGDRRGRLRQRSELAPTRGAELREAEPHRGRLDSSPAPEEPVAVSHAPRSSARCVNGFNGTSLGEFGAGLAILSDPLLRSIPEALLCEWVLDGGPGTRIWALPNCAFYCDCNTPGLGGPSCVIRPRGSGRPRAWPRLQS